MTYEEAILYIQSLTGRGIAPGLSRVNALLGRLGNPEKELNYIHIAGTNGKGSFGAYLSSILVCNNNSCGRFVSPCIGDYNNTFLYNNSPVGKDLLCHCMSALKDAISSLEKEGIYPTSFEAETALALLIFKSLSPDYVLMECGMGGRNDATNVIPSPVLAVITKIAMDHTSFLGSTLEEIASQKAGIIKSGAKVISALQEIAVSKVIEDTASIYNEKVIYPLSPENVSYSINETHFLYDKQLYITKMLGTYQPENASLAICAAQTLNIPKDAIKEGIEKAYWEYRFERIGKFFLDGTHNPNGAMALKESIKTYLQNKDIAYIVGCFKDKDYRKIAEITSPYANHTYCITAPTTRGLDKEILCEAFKKHRKNTSTAESLTDAINKAKNHEYCVIFGSLSFLNEAKTIIEREIHNGAL